MVQTIYLLQLFLHDTLLLCDMFELLSILLWELSSSLFCCSLFGRQSFLRFSVSPDLLFQKLLLHLK